jgi:membrane-associated phospholipid phosphatase
MFRVRFPALRSLPTLALAAIATVLVCAAMYYIPQRWHVGQPAELPFTAVDRALPFWPLSGLVYFAVFPFLGGTFLALRSFDQASRFLCANLLAQVIAMAIFMLWPITYPRAAFPLPADASALATALVTFCRNADRAVNCLPSLHVSTVTMCLLTLHRCTSWGRRIFPLLLLAGLGMIVSTMTFKQHYLLDVIAGAALGCSSWWSCFGWRARPSDANRVPSVGK